MNDCSSKFLVSEVSRDDAALKSKMEEKKMEKLIKYWNEYLGDCNAVHKYLKEREKKSSNKLVWKFLRFGEVFFRSLGQVRVRYQNALKQQQFVLFQTVFVNNPSLGLLILLSIFITDVKAGVGCAVGGLIATLTDHFLGLHPQSLVDNGVSSFNGSLLGTVLPALFSLVSDNQTQLWIAVCFGAFARY